MKLRLPKRSRWGFQYNWKPDLPDQRDFFYALAPTKLPSSIDLRAQCSPVLNQGQIGSCTANALAGALEFIELRELSTKGADFVFETDFKNISRLFIYYNERFLEGHTSSDSGASLRDGIKTLFKMGACREELWPYRKTLLFKKPIAKCYSEANTHKISEYLRLTELSQIKQSLAQGFPVAFGFSVYESFESTEVAETGIMPMPQPDEHMLGGHAVMAAGYDDRKSSLLIRNSWGTNWGIGGYFWMPYGYLEARLAQDFWSIRK